MKTVDRLSRYNKNLLPLIIALPLLAILTLSNPVLAAPVLTLVPTSGATGTEVTVTGTVFDSYQGDNIYIFFDDIEITDTSLVVPDSGIFSVTFKVPTDAEPGTHWVEARRETASSSMLTKSFFIIEEPDVKLDVFDGYIGTDVVINGSGFSAGRTVTIYYHNLIQEKIGDQTASTVGEFGYQFTIPYSTAGEHKVSAENDEGNSAQTIFKVIPLITLNYASAGPGELLTVTGTGFGNKSNVDIDFSTSRVAKARTNEHGSFEVSFNIPEVKPDTYTIKALDEQGNINKVIFSTTAGANLNQTTGSIGTRLAINGSGFIPGETVFIDFDNLRVATAPTDNNGAFATFFNVPAGNSGNHVITVRGSETIKQFAFSVESEAPPVPAMSLPITDSETRARAYLDWQDVADPSLPITYSIQVASDQNFSSLVLDKKGITDSEYTFTIGEQLVAVKKDNPYFWRVKAIDGANNDSEWATPWSFYVSAPSVPILALPAYGNEVEKPVFFVWQGVTSLSTPITYSLQVAMDLDFTAIALEKEGLTIPGYTISEEELPDINKEAPYYWRVKAGDSANNESEWSIPGQFYIDSRFTMPAWATYTLIFIGAVALGYLAFWYGKRRAFNAPD
ncbi:IPT/TIG domain-containing protein [Chloroflexota bacterium]